MRSTKKPLIVLLGIFILPLLLAGVLFFLLWLDTDHEQLKNQLQSWFKQQTGYNLSIQGPLQIHFFPLLKLSASQVKITDAHDRDLLEFGQLLVDAEPFSLLQNDLVVKRVSIDKVRLNLERTVEGRFDFQAKTAEGEVKNIPVLPTGLPVDNFELLNSEVIVIDHINNLHLTLSQVNLSVMSSSDNSYQFQFSSSLKEASEYEAEIQAAGALHYDQFWSVNDFTGQLIATHNRQQIDLAVTGDMRFSQAGKLIQASNIQVASDVLAINATINARGVENQSNISINLAGLKPAPLLAFIDASEELQQELRVFDYISGEFAITYQPESFAVQLNSLVINESLAQGNLFFSEDLIRVKLKLDELDINPYEKVLKTLIGNPDAEENGKGQLVSSIHINRLKLPQGYIEQFVNRIQINKGQLVSAEGGLFARGLNPAALYQQYSYLLPADLTAGIELDDKIFKSLEGSLSYSYTENKIALKDVALTVDETTFSGELAYDFSMPELVAQLSIGSLDADRYLVLLPQAQVESSTGTLADDEKTDTAGDLIEWLKQMQGQGAVHIKSLKYQATQYKDVEIRFNSQ